MLEELGTALAMVPDFPEVGTDTRRWQDNRENFVVEENVRPGRNEGLCTAKEATPFDINGRNAISTFVNFRPLSGETVLVYVNYPIQGAQQREGQGNKVRLSKHW